MSLFFDHACARNGSAAGNGSATTVLSWCKAANLLAVGTNDGHVAIHSREGELVDGSSIFREMKTPQPPGVQAVALDWRPNSQKLAVGWSDGQVSVWAVAEMAAAAPKKPSQQQERRPQEGKDDDRPESDRPQSQQAQAPAATCICANGSVHRHAVTVLRWDASGARLITGDKGGTLCIWKADGRGSITMAEQFRRKSAITAVVCCGGLRHEHPGTPAQLALPPFFFGTEAGHVCYADDAGHCTEVQQLTSAVDSLVFHERAARLVVLTRGLLMAQLRVCEDGHIAQHMKAKLSISATALPDVGTRQVAWAGPGLLVAATGEGVVRFWDLDTDENYVLSLTAAGLERGDRAVSIAFSPLQRYLAVGSLHGRVAMWRFEGEYPPDPAAASAAAGGDEAAPENASAALVGGSAGGSRRRSSASKGGNNNSNNGSATPRSTCAEDWVAMPAVQLGGPEDGGGGVAAVAWGPSSGLLAAALHSGPARVLSETVLHRRVSGGVAAIQLGPDTVSIEYEGGSGSGGDGGDADVAGRGGGSGSGAAATVRADVNIKGLALLGRTLVVYSGKEAQVLRLRGPGNVEHGVPFPLAAVALVVDAARDQMFAAVGSRVVVCNLGGGFKSELSFTEAEGAPVLLDLNGSSLVVATDRGLLKLFDVSRRQGGGGSGGGPRDSGSGEEAGRLPVRPLGGIGRFVNATTGNSLGEMRSVRVNADGTRVSVLSDKVHGRALRILEPDSRLHVYDAERDAILSFDFGAGQRCPTQHFWDSGEPRLLAVETRRIRRVGAGNGPAGSGGETIGSFGGPNNNGGAAAKDDGGKESEEGDDGGEDGAVAAAARRIARARSALVDVGAAEAEVVTLFVTAERGILMQDSFALEPPLQALLGVQVPRLYFAAHAGGGTEGNEDISAPTSLVTRALRDFVGLDGVDAATMRALLDFSYHLTAGDMDRAYAAVRLVNSPYVWENMAHMCVKTRRLDVAEVCLGNMGHARGAAAVRLASQAEPELEARMAEVAVQLGMLDDAAKLYSECRRPDLLNRLYQATGLWDRAVQVASSANGDRIHLSSTHHLYARHLEKVGDTQGAIRHYELAGTHRSEVPRLLFERNRVGALEDYVTSGDDPELLRWWAQYCESVGQPDKARRFYGRARDHLSLVRLSCYRGDIRAAVDTVMESGSPSAAYHLARHLEGAGQVHDAVAMYARSGCFNHAIRLAKENGMDGELMSYAVRAKPSLMLDVGAHFEAAGQPDKAVQLYHKGGDPSRALELCFRAGSEGQSAMFDVLKSITDQLGPETSPQVMSRCAQFFVDHGQFDKAVAILVKGGHHLEGVKLCAERKVKITEELAEVLTPPKIATDAKSAGPEADGDDGTGRDGGGGDDGGGDGGPGAAARRAVLLALGACCKQQGSWHLACKKYTQAGERLKAAKCLLKSGDTENILYYARKSRSPEVYVVAANYLQSLAWQEDARLMKEIISLYKKARAWRQLSGFYEACAQVEIDEYRDYDKALLALREALKLLELAAAAPTSAETRRHTPAAAAAAATAAAEAARALPSVRERIGLVERFATARRLNKEDPAAGAAACEALLREPALDQAIRAGDCFAELIGWHYSRRDWSSALRLLQEMRARGIALGPYVEEEMVTEICDVAGGNAAALLAPMTVMGQAAAGAAVGGAGSAGTLTGAPDKDAGSEVGEDIDEGIPDDVEDDASEEVKRGNYK